MKRRTFLIAGLGAGGALLLGWSFVPPRQRLRGAVPIGGGARVPLNGWVTIAPDETVTVIVPKAEMGQGIHTALAMILAEELECDWERVTIEHSPIDGIYRNLALARDGLPLHPDDSSRTARAVRWIAVKGMREAGLMMTGGSTSVRDCWEPMRDAGAAARATLVQAAAAAWKVDAARCTAERGVVRAPDGRTITYGAIVQTYVQTESQPRRELTPASTWQRKDPATFRMVGRPMSRLDTPDKARGRARFGIDVELPGMRHAALRQSPVIGGRVRSMNSAAAEAIDGVVAVVTITPSKNDALGGSAHGVAVVADRWFTAEHALDALDVQWDEGANARLSSAGIMEQLRQAVADGGGRTFFETGDAVGAFTGAPRTMVTRFEAPLLAHTTMEPPNCTVWYRGDRAEVWVGTQVPDFARRTAARVLGLSPKHVTVHQQVLGGGFGRRLEVDMIAQASAVARAVPDTPIKLVWSRTEDITHDFYRPPCVAEYAAALNADGTLRSAVLNSAGPSIMAQYGARMGIPGAGLGPDKTTAEGAFDQPYAWPAVRIRHATTPTPVPVGFWRSVGHSHHAFFIESFVDELAHAAGADPVAYREGLLATHPRALAVLRAAAERSGWGTPLPDTDDGTPRARGIALHRSFGSIVAQVAEVSLSPTRAIRVHKVTAAIDCGFAVNPLGIAQQVEGAIAYGLSAALGNAITVRNGRVEQRTLEQYPMVRMSQMPVVDTVIMPSTEIPDGVGEPGVPPIAPAVANAIFSLTGERLRTLPLRLPEQDPEAAT
jgi:isoquinoline 1-oxidoreductase beta subunit